MNAPPLRAMIVSWDPLDAVGTLSLDDGETLRFGASACSFEPAEGVECWVVGTRPDPLRPGRRRASAVNLTGAVEPSRREAAEAFLERQASAQEAQVPRGSRKRDPFWDGVPWAADGGVAWPDDDPERAALASGLIGAVWVGAVESVATDALDLLAGARPRPGDSDFERLRGAAEVLRTLDTEQRFAVAALIVDVARSSMAWPLTKLENMPGGTVALRLEARDGSGAERGAVDLGADLGARCEEWLSDFADVLHRGERPPRD